MENRSDTYSLAYECCNSVFLEDGRFPTIDAIRDRIHINSPAVIKRAMNDWTLHFVERHRQKLESPNMPAVIVDASESRWKLAMSEAKKAMGIDWMVQDEISQAIPPAYTRWLGQRILEQIFS